MSPPIEEIEDEKMEIEDIEDIEEHVQDFLGSINQEYIYEYVAIIQREMAIIMSNIINYRLPSR